LRFLPGFISRRVKTKKAGGRKGPKTFSLAGLRYD
jgi:hypothetical protein